VGLPLGELALVAGAAAAVGVPDLGDRGHMDRVVETPVAAQRQLPRALAETTLAQRLADLDGTRIALAEPHRFLTA
jgi:hypothetical protein